MKKNAQDRTLSLFVAEETTEPDIKPQKDRSVVDVDEPMLKWVESDISHHEVCVRVARYKNGHRGIQFMRKDGSSMSCVLLSPEMYRQLERCVFRGSSELKELLLAHPDLKGLRELAVKKGDE